MGNKEKHPAGAPSVSTQREHRASGYHFVDIISRRLDDLQSVMPVATGRKSNDINAGSLCHAGSIVMGIPSDIYRPRGIYSFRRNHGNDYVGQCVYGHYP